MRLNPHTIWDERPTGVGRPAQFTFPWEAPETGDAMLKAALQKRA